MRYFILIATLLGACASTQTTPTPAPAAVPSLASCEGVADIPLCLLRLGMAGAAGYREEPAPFLEMADPLDLAAIRATIALGLDAGPDAIRFGDDRHGVVATQRALIQALRLDASGAAPDVALAAIDALPETPDPSNWSIPADPRLRAYIDVADWTSPFAPRPSPALVRAALERAEGLLAANERVEMQTNFAASIAAAYGRTNLRAEGMAFLTRVGQADDFELINLIGDLDAGEAAVRRSAARAECPSAVLADGLGLLAYSAQQQEDVARELRLINETFDNGLATLQRCPNTRATFPALWRVGELRGNATMLALVRRLEPFTRDPIALAAQRNVYEALKDDAQICRVANLQAALETRFGPTPDILEGQSRCQSDLEAWRDESLPPFIRYKRGVEAGVPMSELDALLERESSDPWITQSVGAIAYEALTDNRPDDAAHFAERYVFYNYDTALLEVDNPDGEAPWSSLLYAAGAPHLLQYMMGRARSDGSDTNAPATEYDQERARRAAAAILAHELNTGARTLPAR